MLKSRCQSAQYIQLLYEIGSKTGILLGTRVTKGTVPFGITLLTAIPSDIYKCWRESFCSAKRNRPLCHPCTQTVIDLPFLVRHSEHGGPPGPRSRSKHSLAPIRLYLRNNFGGLRADGANGLSVGAKGYFHSRVTGTDGKNACVIA